MDQAALKVSALPNSNHLGRNVTSSQPNKLYVSWLLCWIRCGRRTASGRHGIPVGSRDPIFLPFPLIPIQPP